MQFLIPIDFQEQRTAKTRFLKYTEKGEAEFHICFTLSIVANDNAKKVGKKSSAHRLFWSAVKWAEMAAGHENGRNSKNFFLPAHDYQIASWLPTSKSLSD